ncbi:hypothetical protein GCM10027212_28190 [Actinotalea caeni]
MDLTAGHAEVDTLQRRDDRLPSTTPELASQAYHLDRNTHSPTVMHGTARLRQTYTGALYDSRLPRQDRARSVTSRTVRPPENTWRRAAVGPSVVGTRERRWSET